MTPLRPLRQRGLTLVELMVAVTVGVMVALLAVSLLVAASAAYVAHAEAAGIDDAGRFALASIERAARQAAFVDLGARDGGADPAGPASIAGLDAASLSSGSEALDNPRAPAVNGSDILALRFSGSGPDHGDGSATTCAGFAVGATEEGWSIFYVGLNGEGQAELRCKYRGAKNWSAEAVIGGVDSFQVLYGLDTDEQPDGQPNRYLSAGALNALDDALALEGADAGSRLRERMRRSHWKRVASIQVSLLVHGARRVENAGAPTVYDLFGPAYGDLAGDSDAGTRVTRAGIKPALRQRERRLFTSTILLRNRAP